MNSLPDDIKWNISTFINGTPAHNYSIVLMELNESFLDMEESCAFEFCRNVCWYKEMTELKIRGKKRLYCSTCYGRFGKYLRQRENILCQVPSWGVYNYRNVQFAI
tara:strand:- start:10578 stop:10895 length:318 start_codon:yes stop_codon:yes gene_type:complete